jgi:hypothetical protein
LPAGPTKQCRNGHKKAKSTLDRGGGNL